MKSSFTGNKYQERLYSDMKRTANQLGVSVSSYIREAVADKLNSEMYLHNIQKINRRSRPQKERVNKKIAIVAGKKIPVTPDTKQILKYYEDNGYAIKINEIK